MDKCEGFSAAGGPVFAEVRSALYDCSPRPKMINYVYGHWRKRYNCKSYKKRSLILYWQRKIKK